MYTTYHLSSAEELNADILEAIKAAFKSKPITIIVEEDFSESDLTIDMKTVLDERLEENQNTYITPSQSIDQLTKKYGL